MPTGIVAMMSNHARRWSGSRISRRTNAGDETADEAHPVAAEIDDQRDCSGHMEPDDEGQIGRLRPVDAQIARPGAADDRGDEHTVAQARHREELSYALHPSDDPGFEPTQMCGQCPSRCE